MKKKTLKIINKLKKLEVLDNIHIGYFYANPYGYNCYTIKYRKVGDIDSVDYSCKDVGELNKDLLTIYDELKNIKYSHENGHES